MTADGAAEGVYVPMTYMLIKEQPEITLYEPQTSSQGKWNLRGGGGWVETLH